MMSLRPFLAMGSCLAVALSSGTANAQTPLGPGFTYQGQLKQNGAPVTVPTNLVFTLFDAPSLGNQIGGIDSQPATPMSGGQFTVILNDSSEFGAAAFNGQRRWLQISVNGTPLTTRQEVTAAPYALFSAAPWVTSGNDLSFSLGKVGVGGLPAASHRLQVIGSTASNSTTADYLLGLSATDGQIGNLYHRSNGAQSYLGLESYNPGGSVKTPIVFQEFGGAVGIGTATPGQKLSVAGTVESTFGGFKFPDGTTQTTAAGPGGGQWIPDANGIHYNSDIGVGVNAALNVRSYFRGTATADTAYFGSDRGPNLSHIHYGANGDWYIRSAVSAGNVAIQDSGGTVSIGTGATGLGKVYISALASDFTALISHITGTGTAIDASCAGAGTAVFANAGSTGRGVAAGAGNGGTGVFGAAGGTGSIGVYGKNSPPTGGPNITGDGVFGESTLAGIGVHGKSNSGYGVYAESTSGAALYANGNVGIGAPAPSFPLSFGGSIPATPKLALYEASGTNVYGFGIQPGAMTFWTNGAERMRLDLSGNVGLGTVSPLGKLDIQAGADSDGFGDGKAISLSYRIGGYRHWIRSLHDSATSAGNAIEFFVNNSGTAAGSSAPGTGNVRALALRGDGTAVVNVLQILGADLTESFNVSDSNPEPGDVVVIDTNHPGELKLSTSAYDGTVAGIISGAGGIHAGVVMGQPGTIADGKHQVALTGRVYCRCDASAGSIAPGDLLTTSDTPGHAMKAVDRDRSHGAILGKAMTGLKQGDTGLVLVLVNLQ